MTYKGFRSVQDWLKCFETLKDYPWDVKIFRGVDLATNEDVKIVNVTGRTPTAASVLHVFSNDYSKELAEFIGQPDDISFRHTGYKIKKLERVVA